MTVMEKLLTVEEVAEKLQVSRDVIWRLLREKKIIGYRVAGSWRIHPDDLQKYLDSQRNK